MKILSDIKQSVAQKRMGTADLKHLSMIDMGKKKKKTKKARSKKIFFHSIGDHSVGHKKEERNTVNLNKKN